MMYYTNNVKMDDHCHFYGVIKVTSSSFSSSSIGTATLVGFGLLNYR